MSIKNNLSSIQENIKKFEEKYVRNKGDVKLIPVSKIHSVEKIIEAMEAGYNVFGESYVQELKQKFDEFNAKGLKQPTWHFIGHLQSNKVKYIAPFIDTIHTVDSLKLAIEIDKRAEQNNRKIKILIQVNTSGEVSKFGIEPTELNNLVEEVIKLNDIELIGLMTIAGLEATAEENEKEFELLAKLLKEINKNYNLNLSELSMGMTSDYELAIKQGSTMIRIGTAIFGERVYE
jgi:pyridoxal phosphate enzyme (YggS family)